MGDKAINNIYLMHEIALVWSISRNVFQPMDYVACLAVYGTIDKKYFSETLYN